MSFVQGVRAIAGAVVYVNVETGMVVFVGLRVGSRVGVTVREDGEIVGGIDLSVVGCAAMDVWDGRDVGAAICVFALVAIPDWVDLRPVLQPTMNRQKIKADAKYFLFKRIDRRWCICRS